MAPKMTALEKAIKSLDDDIAVLEAAKARLLAQQGKAPAKRKPARPTSAPEVLKPAV